MKAWSLLAWSFRSVSSNRIVNSIMADKAAQLVMSTVIFLISRKFTGVGFVSEHVSQGMCRRGWEW